MALINIAEKQNPSFALYVYHSVLRYLRALRYPDKKLSKDIPHYQHRAHYLSDLFAFFQPHDLSFKPQSAIEKTLPMIRLLLQSYVSHLQTTSHDTIKVLYLAYEASIRGWYHAYKNQTESFRQLLIQKLLQQKGWAFADVERNLSFPWMMTDRNPEGSLRHKGFIFTRTCQVCIVLSKE